MNCLTEAIGLALPGNGSTLATHTSRRQLFERAGPGHRRPRPSYYDNDDHTVLPAIASPQAFEKRDGAGRGHGGSTKTRCCTCWPRRRGRAGLRRRGHRPRSPAGCPAWQGRAQHPKYHMEDVHRAGGSQHPRELDRGGLRTATCARFIRPHDEWLSTWDIRSGRPSPEAVELFHAAPGGVRTTEPFSTSNRWDRLDTPSPPLRVRVSPVRCTPYSKDGGRVQPAHRLLVRTGSGSRTPPARRGTVRPPRATATRSGCPRWTAISSIVDE